MSRINQFNVRAKKEKPEKFRLFYFFSLAEPAGPALVQD
jgi:hypothetical protein